MAEAEAAVDPRLIALGLASEIVIEFPEGTIEVDVLESAALDEPVAVGPPVAREQTPVVAEPPVVPDQRLVVLERPLVRPEPPPAPVIAPTVDALLVDAPIEAEESAAVRLELASEPIPEPVLPESAVLIQTSVVHGLWPRRAELTLEELGFRVAGPQAVAIR